MGRSEASSGHEPLHEDNSQFRVVIGDSDPLVRRVIKSALQHAKIAVLADVATGSEAVSAVRQHGPELVLLNVRMPEIDGIEVTRKIRRFDPSIKVVLWTEDEDYELGIQGLQAGACGYLSKDVELPALPRALWGLRQGEAAISRQLTMQLIDHLHRGSLGGGGLRPIRSDLTGRQWEVLDLMYQGHSTDEIADDLVLSNETVRSHIKGIYRKLGVRSRADAIAAVSRLREPEA